MGRVQAHNQDIRLQAQGRAQEMRMFPSKLEEKMMKVLDYNLVFYEFQKIFYIYAGDGWIQRYYIADFYIPKRNVIIEVDGKKYHEHHRQHDKDRDRLIQKQYEGIEILRYGWHDLDDNEKMRALLKNLV